MYIVDVILVAGVSVRAIVVPDTLETVPINLEEESYILFPFPISEASPEDTSMSLLFVAEKLLTEAPELIPAKDITALPIAGTFNLQVKTLLESVVIIVPLCPLVLSIATSRFAVVVLLSVSLLK